MNVGMLPRPSDVSHPMRHVSVTLLLKFGGPSLVLRSEAKVSTTSSISRIVHRHSVFKFIGDMPSTCRRGSEACHVVINVARLRSQIARRGLSHSEHGMCSVGATASHLTSWNGRNMR